MQLEIDFVTKRGGNAIGAGGAAHNNCE